ncbi:hypothetical protein OEZ85_005516 [Tetradesmus obliquus]|uniref:Uncharacterized protein n=2 Tax=Tetradesmus obliquus TaxID=3088 RepID=A0ABY8UDY0_TETOB|nr:hypothetical protein OEZ85_005516 [Tetradesmus obliquus]|eukprot:jgi/Sobl393_1/7072/SZX75688.1
MALAARQLPLGISRDQLQSQPKCAFSRLQLPRHICTRSISRTGPVQLQPCQPAFSSSSSGSSSNSSRGSSRARVPLRVQASAGAAGAGPLPEEPHRIKKSQKPGRTLILGLLAAAAAIAACIALYVSGHASSLQAYLVNGPAGRSGLLAAFCLIFLSELGDKTFFIAALLAMKLGRWISFVGSVAALAVMTLISVGIGAAFSRVPDALKSSLPVGEIAGVALLVFFGIKALKAARDAEATGASTSEEELADAEEAVAEFESSSSGKKKPFASLLEVAGLIFLAEWGDRSMLATIALGAAQNPVGVAVGATAGHALATALAVAGGALAGKYISEKTVNLVSGILFLLFAAATVYTML